MDYNDGMRDLLRPIDEHERRRRAVASVWEDVDPWLGSSTEDRATALVAVLRLADAIADGAEDGREYRRWVDRRSEEAEALWLRLVREHRAR